MSIKTPFPEEVATDLEITLIDGFPRITAIRQKRLHQQSGR
jgi:hypothetical protein